MGRRVVASLWAAVAMPYVVLSLLVPIARALELFESVPFPLIAALSSMAGVAVVLGVPRLSASLPASLDDWFAPTNRRLATLWAVGGVIASIMLGRIAVFLADPSLVGFSINPNDPFLARHSCLTAYMHGAILSLDPTANVYDLAFVEEVATEPGPLPPTAEHFAPFTLDPYGYPPPFLLLSRALLVLTSDFALQRLWFATGSLLLLLFACASAAKTLGGVAERRIWLVGPLFLSNLPMVATLQIGNFHAAAVALCLLCWVALERRQDGLAGVLLAIATLAKIFPGLLGVLLLVQMRWRAVGYTCLTAAALCGLSVVVLGTQVWIDFFVYHLPKVQSGEALRFLAGSAHEIAYNHAPFGLPFKFALLGLADGGWDEARMVTNIYTALLFVLAVLAGRSKGSSQHRALVWMAIVMLASLRSPYAAPLVISTMSLLFMLYAAEVRTRWHVAGLLLVMVVLTNPLPVGSDAVHVVESLVRMSVLIGVCLYLVLRRDQRRESAQNRQTSPTAELR